MGGRPQVGSEEQTDFLPVIETDEPVESWLLSHRDRPWLLNSERSGGARGVGGYYGRAGLVGEWRSIFARLCLIEHVVPLRWITVDALQVCRDKRVPDPGNCYPAVKAAIDGIVDAGVVPDDNGTYLHALTFRAPAVLGYDALVLRVTGPRCTAVEAGQRERDLQDRLRRQVSRR